MERKRIQRSVILIDCNDTLDRPLRRGKGTPGIPPKTVFSCMVEGIMEYCRLTFELGNDFWENGNDCKAIIGSCMSPRKGIQFHNNWENDSQRLNDILVSFGNIVTSKHSTESFIDSGLSLSLSHLSSSCSSERCLPRLICILSPRNNLKSCDLNPLIQTDPSHSPQNISQIVSRIIHEKQLPFHQDIKQIQLIIVKIIDDEDMNGKREFYQMPTSDKNSPDLFVHLLALKATWLWRAFGMLAALHLNLQSLKIIGIPMRSQTEASSSLILHSIVLWHTRCHLSQEKQRRREERRQKRIDKEKKQDSSHETPSHEDQELPNLCEFRPDRTLKWKSVDRTTEADCVASSCFHKITPRNSTGRASACVMRHLFQGKPVACFPEIEEDEEESGDEELEQEGDFDGSEEAGEIDIEEGVRIEEEVEEEVEEESGVVDSGGLVEEEVEVGQVYHPFGESNSSHGQKNSSPRKREREPADDGFSSNKLRKVDSRNPSKENLRKSLSYDSNPREITTRKNTKTDDGPLTHILLAHGKHLNSTSGCDKYTYLHCVSPSLQSVRFSHKSVPTSSSNSGISTHAIFKERLADESRADTFSKAVIYPNLVNIPRQEDPHSNNTALRIGGGVEHSFLASAENIWRRTVCYPTRESDSVLFSPVQSADAAKLLDPVKEFFWSKNPDLMKPVGLVSTKRGNFSPTIVDEETARALIGRIAQSCRENEVRLFPGLEKPNYRAEAYRTLWNELLTFMKTLSCSSAHFRVYEASEKMWDPQEPFNTKRTFRRKNPPFIQEPSRHLQKVIKEECPADKDNLPDLEKEDKEGAISESGESGGSGIESEGNFDDRQPEPPKEKKLNLLDAFHKSLEVFRPAPELFGRSHGYSLYQTKPERN